MLMVWLYSSLLGFTASLSFAFSHDFICLYSFPPLYYLGQLESREEDRWQCRPMSPN